MKFKMAFGRGAYYSLAIGTLLELVMAAVVIFVGVFYLGLGIILLTVAMVWFCWAIYQKSHYEITDSEIMVCLYGSKKKRYPIDKITEIRYIDTGTEWKEYPPNARYQLEIYFDKKYLKSIMP